MVNGKLDTSRPPAVVVGMELGGLGVTRSLARMGVEVVALDRSRQKPEAFTRHVSNYVVAETKGRELIECLLELQQTLPGRPVLIPTQRLPALLISEHRELLEPYFSFVLPSHAMLLKMENKDALRGLAENAGIRIPATVVVSDEARLESASNLRYPCILKPADNKQVYMARFKKAYIVNSFDELREIVKKIWPHYRQLVVQEWITGPDSNLYFCLQYRNSCGEVLASFVGQKLYSWPLGTGATASCTRASGFVDEVQNMTNTFLDATGHVGFGSAEFKLDAKSGEFYFIEPTAGRTDQQEEVATLNGINIPYAGYLDAIGEPVVASR